LTYNECRTPTRVADRERRADNMTTPSARRRRNPARQESPSPERIGDAPVSDDPFAAPNDNVSQQLRQMQNDTAASRTAVSDLRARLAALSVPNRATTRGRPRGTTAPRAAPDPDAMQQASESSRSRGGSRVRGRGRPRQAEQRAPPVNPNYKMALQPTSVLLQQLPVHYLGRMNVACPDCGALHWEAEKLVKTSRVSNPKFGQCCKAVGCLYRATPTRRSSFTGF
jgi:hypothetical protein